MVSFVGVSTLLPAGLTVPISGSIVTAVAQLVCHSSVVLSPAVISAGLAAKVRISGSGTVVVVTTVVSGFADFLDEGRRVLILFRTGTRMQVNSPCLLGRHPEASEKTSTTAIPAIKNLLQLDISPNLIELYDN